MTKQKYFFQCSPCGRLFLSKDDSFLDDKSANSNNRFSALFRHRDVAPSASRLTDHRCFGATLCCSPTEGCLSPESAEAAICTFEDNDPEPCRNEAPSCTSAGPDAQCVTEGLCCNPKGKTIKDFFTDIFNVCWHTYVKLGLKKLDFLSNLTWTIIFKNWSCLKCQLICLVTC